MFKPQPTTFRGILAYRAKRNSKFLIMFFCYAAPISVADHFAMLHGIKF